MPVATFLKNKQKRIESKYHQVAKRFESKYELIHRKLTSKFHRESTETELIRSKIHNLIAKSTESIESKIKSEGFIPVFSERLLKILISFIQIFLIGFKVDSQDKQYE